MALLSTDALVLRGYKLGETSRIVVLLTRERGKLRAVARGARGRRPRYRSALEPLSEVKVSLYGRQGAELLRLGDAELVRSRMFPRQEQAPRIGRYRVLRKLGRGGMGTVVAAHDETLDRRVALKLLHDDLAAKPRQRHRLMREAQAMARVSHPNVVTVYEADVFDDQLYIVQTRPLVR